MFNFFAENSCRNGNRYYINGTDFNHIKNVLRMKEGDKFLVSFDGKSDLCRLEAFESDTVVAVIEEENYQNCELPVRIYLFQGLPKSDKMELIIQKCVELGVTDIVPVEMSRSIVKIEDKKKQSKITRWQAIAESAAKQSKRNVIPEIHPIISFNQAVKEAQNLDITAVPYESEEGMVSTQNFLNKIKPNR
jgi:16S rRNA (uracil1498-N3)-methyltransferase